MKRLSILFAAIVLFTVGSYAVNGDEYTVLWSLNNKTTQNAVKEYINANSEQSQHLHQIFYESRQRLVDAMTDNDKEAAQKALYFNLANVKSVLTPKQFRKYLEILNVTYHQQQTGLSLTSDK